ncbi:MAG: amidohydrolase family protein, partial [Microlunatus sp.]|nr:amidohydrolase family protein [Microlunatus sp.]
MSTEELMPNTLIRRVRLVPVAGVPAPDDLVDLRIAAGLVREVAPDLKPGANESVTDADGRWAIPGLWDHHVHMGQWAATLSRIDMSGTAGPDEVLARLRIHLPTLSAEDRTSVVVGFGHRSATWARQPTVAELDEASGTHPVVLVSGDAHNGWLNSAALALLEAPTTSGALSENDWFPILARLDTLPGAQESAAAAYSAAVAKASALGIVGVGDMEFGSGYLDWPARFAAGIKDLRVRAATYREGLDDIVAAGLRTGDELGESGGLLQMGPLKIISDGSLNTRTAYCHEPYVDGASLAHPRGKPNLSSDELIELCGRATAHGLTMAVHAIGDAAVAQTLDAFEQTGAAGGIEHAQLVDPTDLARMAKLRVSASVQPAHLLDDRDVTMTCWPDRADRCFP